MNYEFAIKKDVLKSGEVVFTPVCREKGRLHFVFPNPWNRIVKLYNHYFLLDIDVNPNLSYQDCVEHIEGYKQKLRDKTQNEIAVVEFHTLEEELV